MRSSCKRLASLVTRPRVSDVDPTPYSWVDNTPQAHTTGPLAGVNIAIKENISYASAPTSCSSKTLQNYRPPYNATCVNSLLRSGATIAGMTKMDEFGMGSETRNLPEYYTPVHNPAGPSSDTNPRAAGGSSGGSAAAVAEGSCDAALGTDTGGSVRLPASYCGIVGLKPSYGLVSRHGVVAYADSLDCVGVMANDVDTVRNVFGAISHPDERDMTCADASVRQQASSIATSSLSRFASDKPLSGLRIGLPVQTHLPEPYVQLSRDLLSYLKSLGATLVPVDLPSCRLALPAYYVLASAEASSNLGRYGGGWFGSTWERELTAESGDARRRRIRTEGFGGEVKRRVLAGTHALSANEFNNTYLKALYLRRSVREDFAKTFRIPHPSSPQRPVAADGVDVVLHPTAIRTAPRLDGSDDAPQESGYLQDLLTVPSSLAGLPSMSVPAGNRDGWPVGVSIVGQWGMEEILFWAGRQIEKWSAGRSRSMGRL
ncbi:glutamyl-tRNA amidotransferase subunit A (Glu-ADT subunit A) [Papiliotrema laurentii]|uniref:Glutamyl-tRNA(Gln) amidotransferase subunit A, mitochondrial n=1 Tax=Papiliotrema laurentii TaxID=5418 RepID=A0AAD9L7Z5_PAPLA|nr:glutamyl-tRNA amidotransferase subunit A (Glu-ADT subunit A) [Papiliotrema laurentii]